MHCSGCLVWEPGVNKKDLRLSSHLHYRYICSIAWSHIFLFCLLYTMHNKYFHWNPPQYMDVMRTILSMAIYDTTVSLFANTTDPTVALPQTLHVKVVIKWPPTPVFKRTPWSQNWVNTVDNLLLILARKDFSLLPQLVVCWQIPSLPLHPLFQSIR